MGSMDDSRMYKRQKRKEKHLYLVLDEWDKGFTIRKIDADSPDDHSRSLLDEPPVIRLLSPNPIHRMDFAALGSSHILAASNKHPATLVYDTDTAGLITGPPVPDALQDAYTILLPAGDDTLYAFAYYLDESQAVEVLSLSSTTEDLHSSVPTMHWSWTWKSTAPLPFTQHERICSYAAHHLLVRLHHVRLRSSVRPYLVLRHRALRVDAPWGLGAAFHGQRPLRQLPGRLGWAPRGWLHRRLPGRLPYPCR
uniref:Uncharacterized protein n=1 Tax=Aegilops tauschii subsp. strangulata TaxID=200361 RepID=A0A453NEM9_AEGTS